MGNLDQQPGENRKHFTTPWGAEYSTDCQTEDPKLVEFLRDKKTQDFIGSNFKPGEITIQEGEGNPVDTDTQERILEVEKIILALLVLTGNPLNEKPEEPIKETASFQELTAEQKETVRRAMSRLREQRQKPEHPTNYLRPERINDPVTRVIIRKYEDRAPGRLREFGTRLMYKLAERTLETKEHSIEALRGYNGLIIGQPNTKKRPSFTDLLKSRQAFPQEVAYLINFEAENGFLTEEDLAEILQIAKSNEKVAQNLRGVELFKLYPISMDTISAFNISAGELAEVARLKADDGSLDSAAIDTLTTLVFSYPELAEALDGKVDGHIKQVLDKAGDSTYVNDGACREFVQHAVMDILLGEKRDKFMAIPGMREKTTSQIADILSLPGFSERN